MEIHSLHLRLIDKDLIPLIERFAVQEEEMENLTAHFTTTGLVVNGEYRTPFGFRVAFKTLWVIVASGSEIRLRLETLDISGIPASILRGVLIKMIRDSVPDVPGVSVRESEVVIQVEDAAKAEGVSLSVDFTAVQMAEGSCGIVAGKRGD
ncbi:MAG: hypothetical protein EBV06_15040 [Planctomycetia bacterium]|nr:hypothetical protein [Planctomycetia bacterium]